MITTHSERAPLSAADVVVLDYLAAHWAESDDLSPELRDDLMATVAAFSIDGPARLVPPRPRQLS